MTETQLTHFKDLLMEEKRRIEDERASYAADTRGGKRNFCANAVTPATGDTQRKCGE